MAILTTCRCGHQFYSKDDSTNQSRPCPCCGHQTILAKATQGNSNDAPPKRIHWLGRLLNTVTSYIKERDPSADLKSAVADAAIPFLRLEPYVFRVLENQRKLSKCLGDGEPHAIDVDTGRGTLLLRRKGDKPALECRYQILGSLDTRANTWLWAWANEVSSFPQPLLRGVKAIRDQARKENKGVFLQAGPIPVPDAYFGSELSIICAGYLNGFTCFAFDITDSLYQFTAIEKCPEAAALILDPGEIITGIQRAISGLVFDHRTALIAYLGEPHRRIGEQKWVWRLGWWDLVVELDRQDRIGSLEFGKEL